MEKIAITENALKTSGGDVFKALEIASKEIYKKKIQDVAVALHMHTPRMVMDTVIHGMNLVENENVNNNFSSWSGQYKLIKKVDSDYLFIINMSFDLNDNLNDIIIQILNLVKQENVKKIYFTKSKCYEGINNCYYGDYNSMYNLINYFYNNYNNILDKYEKISYDLIIWQESKKLNYNYVK
jgi:hypothetical protein